MPTILTFFDGTGVDANGRTIAEIQQWTNEQLEECHDQIQWMFPVPEPSKYNFMATVSGEGYVLTELLELILRLKDYTPEAFAAGIDFLRKQSPKLGEREAEWNALLDGMVK
jgi:hypothetical protein